MNLDKIFDNIFIKLWPTKGIDFMTAVWMIGLLISIYVITTYDSDVSYMTSANNRLVMGSIIAYIMLSNLYWDTKEWQMKHRQPPKPPESVKKVD